MSNNKLSISKKKFPRLYQTEQSVIKFDSEDAPFLPWFNKQEEYRNFVDTYERLPQFFKKAVDDESKEFLAPLYLMMVMWDALDTGGVPDVKKHLKIMRTKDFDKRCLAYETLLKEFEIYQGRIDKANTESRKNIEKKKDGNVQSAAKACAKVVGEETASVISFVNSAVTLHNYISQAQVMDRGRALNFFGNTHKVLSMPRESFWVRLKKKIIKVLTVQ